MPNKNQQPPCPTHGLAYSQGCDDCSNYWAPRGSPTGLAKELNNMVRTTKEEYATFLAGFIAGAGYLGGAANLEGTAPFEKAMTLAKYMIHDWELEGIINKEVDKTWLAEVDKIIEKHRARS